MDVDDPSDCQRHEGRNSRFLGTSSGLDRPGVASLLFLTAWCGLAAGLLEVGALVLRKQVLDADHFYRMSRHFVWLTPLANLAVFLAVGLLGCVVILVWPRHGRWLFTRVLLALTLLPPLLVLFSRIYTLAWLAVALGMAARLVPFIERPAGVSGDSS